jgi:xanthine dehydrogenase accessory factor
MREILADVTNWISKDEQVALATVVRTWGSSPRRVGAKMALTPGAKISGSVSGGCVETAVFEAGIEALKSRRPQLLKFGVADDTAWEVGLACGGHIEVYVKPLDPVFFDHLRSELAARRTFCVASIVSGPSHLVGREILIEENQIQNSLGDGLDEIAQEKARYAMAEGQSMLFDLEVKNETLQLFVDVENPPPTLVIIGGVHIAIALTALAKTLGFDTIVVDPRRAFGSAERFPHVDRLLQAWPQEAFKQISLNRETAIASLTHDPKIDDPALKIALKSRAFYIGALGSQKTQDKRRQRLSADGLTEEELDRLHGPIGLAIGGETPEEIALAIMSEIVATRHHSIVLTQKAA